METFDETILPRMAGLNMVRPHVLCLRPLHNGRDREFAAVVQANEVRLTVYCIVRCKTVLTSVARID